MVEWFEEYESYDKALEIEPEDKLIVLNKGIHLIRWGIDLLKQDDYDQAMIRANEAISLLEDEAGTYYSDALALKATIHMFTENYEDSLKYFNKALEINPNEYLYESKKELIKLMNDSSNIH